MIRHCFSDPNGSRLTDRFHGILKHALAVLGLIEILERSLQRIQIAVQDDRADIDFIDTIANGIAYRFLRNSGAAVQHQLCIHGRVDLRQTLNV